MREIKLFIILFIAVALINTALKLSFFQGCAFMIGMSLLNVFYKNDI